MSSLQKARTLEEAFPKLVPEPLEKKEELDAFYAKPDCPQNSRLARLYTALRFSDRNNDAKWIIGGTQGNGKTTELQYLMTTLTDKYFWVYH